FGQIMDGVQQLSVTLALGGAGQFVKQSAPQIADLTLRLGLDNLGLIGQSVDLLVNHKDLVRELMKDSPITLREMDRLETQPDALSQKEKRALEELLGKHLGKAGKAMTATMRLSMKPLTLADLSATQIAWVANYLHYLKKEGGKNAIKLDALRKPNKSAQSYATFQTEILANVSNPSDKPKLYKNVGGRIMMALMPYASFSVNSKMELATNLGKLSD